MRSPSTGPNIRLARIVDGRHACLILTLDALAIYPSLLPRADVDLIVRAWINEGGDAVMGFPGSLSRVPPDRRIARIGLLNISTVHRDALTKVPVLSSSYWIRQGVDAVAIQLHLGAEQEGPMLSAVGAAIESATDFGLPVLGIAYARGGDYTGESVDLKDMAPAHAARLMMELGASIIKVPLLGGPELQPIVEICDPVPVIVAGGDVMDLDRWLSQVSDALAAGVAGVCVGRNILGRPDWQRAISRLADAASK